jgi:hypothetical protein
MLLLKKGEMLKSKRWVEINKNRHSKGSELIRNDRRNYRRIERVIV